MGRRRQRRAFTIRLRFALLESGGFHVKSCEGCEYLEEVVGGKVNFCKRAKWVWIGRDKKRPYVCNVLGDKNVKV